MAGPRQRRYQAKRQCWRSTERTSAACPCMQSGKSSSWIWRPAVPRWEREFCLKIGLFPWKRLVEEKKYIHLWPKVMQWDDSAGELAFNNAKRQFWAQINHLPCNMIDTPSRDAYVDEIDWSTASDDDENYNSALLSGSERVDSDDDEDHNNKEDHHENLPNNSINVLLPIQLEDIQPTGWDDVACTDEMHFLTGLVVGE